MSAKGKAAAELAARLKRVLWECRSYGQLEAAAGVTDRVAFWRGKTEEQVRAELHDLVLARLRRGELEATP